MLPFLSHLQPASLAAMALLLSLATPSHAADSAERKAAVVYNLCKFIDWPASAFQASPDHFTICLWGDDPVYSSLQALAGKSVRGRKIQTRQVTAEQTAGCHVLFVSQAEAGAWDALQAEVKTQAVLSVSEAAGFAGRGGIAGLIQAEDRIRFEINLDAARQAGLSVSAPLLELATVVRKPE